MLNYQPRHIEEGPHKGLTIKMSKNRIARAKKETRRANQTKSMLTESNTDYSSKYSSLRT